MSSYVKRALPLLKVIAKAKPKVRNAIIEHAPTDLIKAISEIVLNVLKGVVRLTAAQKKRLIRYKNKLRALASNKVSQKIKKRFLTQKGGGAALAGILLPIALSVLSEQLK